MAELTIVGGEGSEGSVGGAALARLPAIHPEAVSAEPAAAPGVVTNRVGRPERGRGRPSPI